MYLFIGLCAHWCIVIAIMPITKFSQIYSYCLWLYYPLPLCLWDAGPLKCPVGEQNSVPMETMEQLDFCTCAFVSHLRPCHNSIRRPCPAFDHTHSETHAHTHTYIQSHCFSPGKWMRVPVQKNIWLGYNNTTWKRTPAGWGQRAQHPAGTPPTGHTTSFQENWVIFGW